MSIVSYKKENDAANDALENYVAYFKMAHGSLPNAISISRMGLSLGMNTVDARSVLDAGDKIADQMRDPEIKKAVDGGDMVKAMSLIKKNDAQRLNEIHASDLRRIEEEREKRMVDLERKRLERRAARKRSVISFVKRVRTWFSDFERFTRPDGNDGVDSYDAAHSS